MSPTSMATRLRDMHAETWNVPRAASVPWTNKLWHNWQPVWEMSAHYDAKRSERRLTAVCRASESERSRTLHLAGLLARVNNNFVGKRSTGAVFLDVCYDLRSRMSWGTQLQAEHPHIITLSTGCLPVSLTDDWITLPLIHIDFSWHASWGWTFRFYSTCAWTPWKQSPAMSGWCSRRMTRPTYPRSAIRHGGTATLGHTATLSSAVYGTGGLLLAGQKLPRCFSLIPRVVSEGPGQCNCCDWYSSVSCGDLRYTLICSSQRKTGQK